MNGQRVTHFKVFIASPSDVKEERKLFKETLELLNTSVALNMNAHLEPVGWETTLHGEGRPQALINEDLKKCQLAVFVLWKRWGSPTGTQDSGFHEEYKLALSEGIPTILFFRDVPTEMMEDPGDQLKKVLAFRDQIEEEKKSLFGRYATLDEFKNVLFKDVCGWLFKEVKGIVQALQPPISSNEEIAKRNAELEEQIKKTQSKAKKAEIELIKQAWNHADEGRLTKAEELFAKVAGEHESLYAINQYALFLLRIGSIAKAEELLLKLGAIAGEVKDDVWQAVAFGNLGLVYEARGDLNKADEMHLKSLAINEGLGRKEGIANDYGNLGNVYLRRGDFDKAEEMFLDSLAINERLGRKEGIANNYGNLGNVYKTRGDLDKAEEMYRKALAIDEELGRKEGMARSYGNLGNVYKTRGDLEEAEKMFLKSLAINEELGRKEGMAIQHRNLGLLFILRGDKQTAERHLTKAIESYTIIGAKNEIEDVKKELDELKGS